MGMDRMVLQGVPFSKFRGVTVICAIIASAVWYH